ncbi:uncharacterized protein BJX67DRAFT_345968, partial [Aspergillus lucknowensis]
MTERTLEPEEFTSLLCSSTVLRATLFFSLSWCPLFHIKYINHIYFSTLFLAVVTCCCSSPLPIVSFSGDIPPKAGAIFVLSILPLPHHPQDSSTPFVRAVITEPPNSLATVPRRG